MNHLWGIHWFFALHWPFAATTSEKGGTSYIFMLFFQCLILNRQTYIGLRLIADPHSTSLHLRIKLTHQIFWFSWWVLDNDHSMFDLDTVSEDQPLLLRSPLSIHLCGDQLKQYMIEFLPWRSWPTPACSSGCCHWRPSPWRELTKMVIYMDVAPWCYEWKDGMGWIDHYEVWTWC